MELPVEKRGHKRRVSPPPAGTIRVTLSTCA